MAPLLPRRPVTYRCALSTGDLTPGNRRLRPCSSTGCRPGYLPRAWLGRCSHRSAEGPAEQYRSQDSKRQRTPIGEFHPDIAEEEHQEPRCRERKDQKRDRRKHQPFQHVTHCQPPVLMDTFLRYRSASADASHTGRPAPRAKWQLRQLGTLRVMKRALNLAVLAAAAAVAITLVASRRERRPPPEAGTWVPEDHDS